MMQAMIRRSTLPFRRPRSRRPARRRWRLADPRFYLKAVMVLAGLGWFAVPYGADAINAGFGARGTDGCRVLRVVDGDTVTLWCPDYGMERVRLTGFDAPELFSPECAGEYAQAVAATWYLRRLLAEGEVLTVQHGRLDRYDRRLAALSIDGVPVAQTMIAAGHGRAYGGGQRGGWC
jgi:micrococcal nuclease